MRVGLILQIDQIIKDELDAAKKKFPANNSRHESYAVLREEFEEMQDEERKLSNELDNIWDAVKKNTDPGVLLKYLNRVQNISRQLAAEAVQTAAMIDKFIEYVNSEIDDKQETEKPEPKKRGRKPKVAPVQQEPEIKSVDFIKPKWSEEQKRDIQRIKDAHKIKRAEKKENEKKGRIRKDIDNTLIVYMVDEQGRKFKDIAKELGCCEQTVRNRYEVGKRDSKEKGKA